MNPVKLSLDGRRVLVTGATGFVGRHVVRRLVERDAFVKALVRDPEKAERLLPRPGVELIRGDITDSEAVRAACSECDFVFHVAGVIAGTGNEDRMEAVNVRGTQTVADAALAEGVRRFVHVSTVAVYGPEQSRTINEHSSRTESTDPYGRTKRLAEEYVRELHHSRQLPAIIVQPGDVYGPEDHHGWTTRPLELIRSGKALLPDGGRGRLALIYIDDLVVGLLDAAERGRAGQSYILCGDEDQRVADLFEYIRNISGAKPIRSLPLWIARTGAVVMEAMAPLFGKRPLVSRAELRLLTRYGGFDNSKAKDELGFHPHTTLSEGMQAVQQWLASAGYLD
jgi:nucleoside-diphosphate-sugar epimerase